MRKLIAIALIALGSSVVSGAQQAQPRRDILRDEFLEDQKAVADVIDRLFRAVGEHDLGQVESIHFYGPKFSKYDDSGTRQDGELARAAERAGLANVKSYKAKAEGLKVDVFGDVAVATFVFDYIVTTDKQAVRGKAHSTLVFARDGAAWRIVHEHHSPVTKASE
jgi:ketosteroid isomerase-like protein